MREELYLSVKGGMEALKKAISAINKLSMAPAIATCLETDPHFKGRARIRIMTDTDEDIALYTLEMDKELARNPPLDENGQRPEPESKMTGVELIAEARKRHIGDEDYNTVKGDQGYTDNELLWLALNNLAFLTTDPLVVGTTMTITFPDFWHDGWLEKPEGPKLEQLAEIGALAAAEIDRMNAATR
jgi:hypothetical protein